MNFLKLDVLWKKNNGSQIFLSETQSFENSLHGQKWSDFEKVSLKCQAELEFFSKQAKKSFTIRHIRENQNHKSQFSDEFCWVAPSRARTKN
jgi:hypothetical protein